MMAIAQATPDMQADNDLYRITKWTLPSGATTGPYPHGFRATILPSTSGQLLCKSDGQEQPIDLVAGQPVEIARGAKELVNANEHEVAITMIEFK
jgi:quercetin dioxygenase-like cupin family protein